MCSLTGKLSVSSLNYSIHPDDENESELPEFLGRSLNFIQGAEIGRSCGTPTSLKDYFAFEKSKIGPKLRPW